MHGPQGPAPQEDGPSQHMLHAQPEQHVGGSPAASLTDGPSKAELDTSPAQPCQEASYASASTDDPDVIHLDLTGNTGPTMNPQVLDPCTSFVLLPGGFLVPVDTSYQAPTATGSPQTTATTSLAADASSAATHMQPSTSQQHPGTVLSTPDVQQAAEQALPGPRRQRTNPGDAPTTNVSDSSVFSPAELTQLIQQTPVRFDQSKGSAVESQPAPLMPLRHDVDGSVDRESSTEVDLVADDDDEEGDNGFGNRQQLQDDDSEQQEEEEEEDQGAVLADALPAEPIRLFAIPQHALPSVASPRDVELPAPDAVTTSHASSVSVGGASPAAVTDSSSASHANDQVAASQLLDAAMSSSRTTLAKLSVSARYARDDEPDSPTSGSSPVTAGGSGVNGGAAQGVSRSADFQPGEGRYGEGHGEVGRSLKDAGSAPAAGKVNLGGTLRGPQRISMSTLKEMALQQEQRQKDAAAGKQPASSAAAAEQAAPAAPGLLASVVSSLLHDGGEGEQQQPSQQAAQTADSGQPTSHPRQPPSLSIATSQSVPAPADGGLPPSPFASLHANSKVGPKTSLQKRASRGLHARKSAPDLASPGFDASLTSPFAMGASFGGKSSHKPTWLTPPASSSTSPNRPSSPVPGGVVRKRSSSRQASPALSVEHPGSEASDGDGDELHRESSGDSDQVRSGRHGPPGARSARSASRLQVTYTELVTQGTETGEHQHQGDDGGEQAGGESAGQGMLHYLTSLMGRDDDGGDEYDDDAEEVEEEVEDGYDYDNDDEDEDDEDEAFEVADEEDMPSSMQMRNELNSLKEELNAQRSVAAGLRGELRKYTLLTAQLDAQLHGLKQSQAAGDGGGGGGAMGGVDAGGPAGHVHLLTASSTAVNMHAAKAAPLAGSDRGRSGDHEPSSPTPRSRSSSTGQASAEGSPASAAPPPAPPVIGLQADKRLTLYKEALSGSLHTACGSMHDELLAAQDVLKGKEVLDSGSEKVILIKFQKIIQAGADATRHLELLQQDIAVSHNKQGGHRAHSQTGSLVTDAFIRQSLPPPAFATDEAPAQDAAINTESSTEMTAELAELKSENARLKQEVETLTAQLAAYQAQPATPISPFAVPELPQEVKPLSVQPDTSSTDPSPQTLNVTGPVLSNLLSNMGPGTPSPKVLHASHEFTTQSSSASDIVSTRSGNLLSTRVSGSKAGNGRGLSRPLSMKARSEHQVEAAGWQLERQMLLKRLAELEEQLQGTAASGTSDAPTVEAESEASREQPTTPTQSTPAAEQPPVQGAVEYPSTEPPASSSSPSPSLSSPSSSLSSSATPEQPLSSSATPEQPLSSSATPEQPSAERVAAPAQAVPPAGSLVDAMPSGAQASAAGMAPDNTMLPKPTTDPAAAAQTSTTPPAVIPPPAIASLDAAPVVTTSPGPAAPQPMLQPVQATHDVLKASQAAMPQPVMEVEEQAEQQYKQQLTQYEEQIRELQARLAAVKANARSQSAVQGVPANLSLDSLSRPGTAASAPAHPAGLLPLSPPPADLLSQLDSWRTRYLALQERFQRAQSQLPSTQASSSSTSVPGALSPQEQAVSSSLVGGGAELQGGVLEAGLGQQRVAASSSLEPAHQRLTNLLNLATAVDNKLKGSGEAVASRAIAQTPLGASGLAAADAGALEDASGVGFEALVRKLEKQIQRVLLTALESSQGRGSVASSVSPPPGSSGLAEMRHELEYVGQENMEMRRQVAAQTNLNAQLALQLQALEQRLAAIQSSHRAAMSPRPVEAGSVVPSHQVAHSAPASPLTAPHLMPAPRGGSPYRGEAGSVRLPLTFDELYRHQTLQRYSARPPPPLERCTQPDTNNFSEGGRSE